MSGRRTNLLEVARADARYSLEAYEFLCHALAFTQKRHGKFRSSSQPFSPDDPSCHVTGQDLLEGVRLFALDQFGMMAFTVFRIWGIQSTSDIGQMVFNLITAGLWHKSPSDSLEDFVDCFDFEKAFVHDFVIEWDET